MISSVSVFQLFRHPALMRQMARAGWAKQRYHTGGTDSIL